MDTYTIERARYAPTDPRLGRHINHDSRNRQYALPMRSLPMRLRALRHERRVPIFDQGNLGSCTGNAALGCLGTGPFYESAREISDLIFDEGTAVRVYSRATVLDGFSGTYKPTDTGSDGVSAAKAMQGFGWISGYRHAFTFDAGMAQLQKEPLITGIPWYESMFDLGPGNVASIAPNSPIAGGHEIVVTEYDPAGSGLVGFDNSWGTSFGDRGHFYMTVATFRRLLSEEGDLTALVPITAPVPAPNPPTPVPPSADADVLALAKAVETWRYRAVPAFGAKAAQKAVNTFLKAKGY